MEKVKLLITGGLGHIGSRLIEIFDESLFEVTVVDNFLTQRYCSLFEANKKINFIEKSFVDIEQEQLEKYHAVIHLAAITDAAGSFSSEQKAKIELTNVDETKNFILKCKKAKIRKFIFPSSTSVYGTSSKIVTENCEDFINPQSPYAVSKVQIEKFIKEELTGSDTNFIILRWGTIFGVSKGMRFHTAINKFCFQAALGTPMTVWKENYDHVRPYLGINDAIRSIFHILKLDLDCWNQIYNVVTRNIELSTIVNVIRKTIDDQNKPQLNVHMVDTPLINQFSYEVSSNKLKETGFLYCDDIEMQIRNTAQMFSRVNS